MPVSRFRSLRLFSVLIATGGLLAGCGILQPLPNKTPIEARLAAFPLKDLPLEKPVSVYWDKHQIPFVVAQTDRDAAFTLGLVHAHLRLGQMEVLRRVASGRIAEMGGPMALQIDHSLRILNYRRAARNMEKRLPEKTRLWLQAFADGVNHYLYNSRRLPHEFDVLALKREKWTVVDLLTIGRLAGTDVNWLAYFRMLRLRDRKDWPLLWARLVRIGSDSTPSFTADKRAKLLEDILGGASKSGSNSIAIMKRRSTTGGALLANDPHLGISMPNLWMIVGVKSPSYHMVGMMVPGLPFVAVGRNPYIAWGGTNMRAASSDLYDVGHLPKSGFKTRTERIKVRWWFAREVKIRETKLGPVLSDAPVLNWKGRPFALRWIGHETGDEVTALLKAGQAKDWASFKAAFKGFAVSGQNMLYADNDGNIGQLIATQQPVRPNETPPDFILPGSDPKWQWKGFLNVMDLPSTYNPAAGYLASANNKPAKAKIPIGFIFSSDDRIDRLKELLEGDAKFSVDGMKKLQLDVYMKSAVELRDAFVKHIERLKAADGLDASSLAALKTMRGWDGYYKIASRGPVAFEIFTFHFQKRFYARRMPAGQIQAYTGFGRIKRLAIEDLANVTAKDDAALRADLRAALIEAGKRMPEFKNWGEMHRLGLAHPLSNAPVIGKKYRFGDYPAAGGTDTLMKTAFGSTDKRHYTRYGQQARHISDMSDIDKNYFVLLGGQDGWFNSTTAKDQAALWRAERYVTVPLRIETVRKNAFRAMTLQPKAK